MLNRIFAQSSTQETQTQPFGLVAWLEQTKVHLPLKGVACRFHVCGDVLSVELDQIFHQNSVQPMDCVYTFPLPLGAAVYRCEMHVGSRLIRARVEEQSRAREIAQEQRATGRRTALVEVERENLFTLSLGNVQAGDVVVIRFAYFQTLTRLADWTMLRIPFCPGVRYIPGQPLLRPLLGRGTQDDTDQVPDASRVSPPRLDALNAEAAYLSVDGKVEDPAGVVTDLSSPSHPVLLHDGERTFHVRLADRTTVPDCDFVLRWTETPRKAVQSAGWVWSEGDEAFALVRLQAPRVDVPCDDEGQDFYFLVDRSGSMAGLKWQKALKALCRFLALLGARDRAWLTFFSTTHTDFAERPLTAAEWRENGALTQLEKLPASGGTELLPALQHTLSALGKHSNARRAALVLITDGEIGNEASIIEALRPHSFVRVHTFGIDTTVNDALLRRMAEQQRGSCSLLMPTDDIAGAVTRLGARLRRPVLTGISVDGAWDVPGDLPPDLHSEEAVMLSLKGKRGPLEITVRGQATDGAERTFQVKLEPRTEPALPLLWAKGVIDHRRRQGKKAEAIELAIQFNLLCEGAAFIAWDEAEKGPVATREIYQPSLRPRVVEAMGGYVGSDSGIADDLELFGQLNHYRPRPLRFLSGRYHRDTHAGTALERRAMEYLNNVIRGRPVAVRDHFTKRAQLWRWKANLLGRATKWFVRMNETEAFADLHVEPLLVILFEWAAESVTEAKSRLEKLETLLRLEEDLAPDSATGLKLARAWAEQELAGDPAFLRRALDSLDQYARRTRSAQAQA